MSRAEVEYPPLALDPIPTVIVPGTDRPLSLVRRTARRLESLWEWCFGMAALMVGLALLSALPVLQFLSLGYLLEASGRVTRTGRLRDGFVGIRLAARVGGIFFGAWLMLWPLRLVSSLWLSAELIEPGGDIARRWNLFLLVLTAFMAVHIALACARGGKLRYFLWPFGTPLWFLRRLRRGGYYTEARDAVWDCVRSLRVPYGFWLGLRGFFGAFVWLAVPVTMLAVRAPLVGALGWLLLVAVLLYLPFLQVQFAAEGRFAALFDVRTVRTRYRQAPWLFALALFITLLFALPLYLLKIEMIPREAAWLPSLVFIAFIFPARLLTGWAYGLASRRPDRRHWFFRWTGRLAMLVIAAAYALIVYFTQFIAWSGIWSLYEQHAFLLPVPFFSM